MKPLPIELAEARRDYEASASGPAAKAAPAELHIAKQALDKADKAFKEDADDPKVRDLAYIAQRKAAVARTQARLQLAKEQQSDAHARLRDRESQQHQSLQAEVERLRQQLTVAEHSGQEASNKLMELQNAQVRQDERGTIISLSGQVLFEQGKGVLLPRARQQLDEIARALVGAKAQDIVIEGFTDSTGSSRRNAQLSQERAEAVVNYLASKGISADHLRAVGRGPSSPIASNDTPEGRATNRRVEIVVQGQAAARR
ncbi:MAG TPA: OmpA family protein [Myxococcota bacterium]|nr:OmpA family protein [Myxococcota bacterium]